MYRFDFLPYQRHFRQPLQTSHGVWKIREGIIIHLTDKEGNTGWGEIAPIPWFGSETLTQGLTFCQQLGETVTQEQIQTIPNHLSACQFSFESALDDLFHTKCRFNSPMFAPIIHNYSYLLPAGEKAFTAWESLQTQINNNHSLTVKWKIGVNSIDTEIEIFKRLMQVLPPQTKIRLDANGGLTLTEARQWLTITDKIEQVEFIEQPLPPQQFNTMLALSNDYTTPLALDESVATLTQLEECYHKGWGGIFVIKAAIAGYPSRLRQFIKNNSLDVVFSSVLETYIGRQASLNLAQELSCSRAVGFGVDSWFIEDEYEWLKMLLKNS